METATTETLRVTTVSKADLMNIMWKRSKAAHTATWWGGVTGTPHARLQHGKEAFTSLYGSPEPDMIVFSSCLWDLYAKGEQGQDLQENYLLEYSINLSALMRNISAAAPASTLLVFRTASLLRSWDCDQNAERTFGNNHIAQLNAKGRATLQHHPRWKLMDVEKLTMHSHCSDHLRDSTHLNQHLTWTVLNLYRNMLKGFASSKAHRALKMESSSRWT
ncbi:hypothetical protein WJX74_008018 [Apatococcus lobatus]|uniref:Uncharacterized protein n=1 Tax=Apatococcus lobatus TaxID=904363 RepID=A0AAW1R0P5_9CHLO